MEIQTENRDYQKRTINVNEGELVLIIQDSRKNKEVTGILGKFKGIKMLRNRTRLLLEEDAYMLRTCEEFAGSTVPLTERYKRANEHGYNLSSENKLYVGIEEIVTALNSIPTLKPHTTWVGRIKE